MNVRSLKVSLTLPYAALIAATALLLVGASWWAGSRSVGALSEQLMQEIVSRIGQAVRHHVHGSGAVLEAAFPGGVSPDADIGGELEAMRTRFWVATSMYTNPNDYVYYGNEAGQGFGLKRLGEQGAELRLKLRADEHRSYYRIAGIDGAPTLTSRERNHFDPRTRIWYQLARDLGRDAWTAVYVDFGTQDLVITRARRVLAADGAFAGVVATDVSLRELGKFVATLHVGERGRAFIVERNGLLVADSRMSGLETGEDGALLRVSVPDSGDAIVRAAYASVAPLFDEAGADAGRIHSVTTVDRDGRAVLVAAQRIVDDAGLDWIAVVAVPRAQILAGINTQVWIALVISLLAVSLVVAVGLRLFGRVAHDVAVLSDAVERIHRGAIDVPIDVSRQDEVGNLARSFRRMHADLFTDRLTGIANRTALTHRLQAATAPGSRPFTLFFIDLNRFKPLNDTYGHDDGDRALREIARRLQAGLRPDDAVARLGGDEFVVLARDVTAPAAVIARFVSVIEAPLRTLENVPDGETVTLGAAIGAARWPEDATDPDELLKYADEAMYRNKAASTDAR